MPAQETKGRHQKAVLWEVSGTDRFGNQTHSGPTELTVRWEYGQTTGLDSQGNTITIDATVQVNQRIGVGSKMWLGELIDWYGTGSGDQDNTIMHVVNYNDVPDLKGRNSRKQVLLKFDKDTTPIPVD
jgi:hypothetical protein